MVAPHAGAWIETHVDLDGNLDLIIANPDLNTISVMLGNGDGTFQGPVDAGTVSDGSSNNLPPYAQVSGSAGSGTSIELISIPYGPTTDWPITVTVTDNTPGFSAPSFSVQVSGISGGASSSGSAEGTIYSFTIPSGGYDAVGNIKQATDSVTAAWTYGYDTLNRLTSAVAAGGSTNYANANGCWTYDPFGNRLMEGFSTTTTTPCASGANDNLQLTTGTPNAKNQVAGFTYDLAGEVVADNQNSYAYDVEGRLCAVGSPNGSGGTLYQQYVYDALGTRVAKGAGTSMTCSAPTSANGFTPSYEYLLGAGGQQVTELSATVSGSTTTLAPVHTNAYAGGRLLGTYDFVNGGLHFDLADPLGTKRAQVSGLGQPELDCLSLPFGNDLGNPRATDCIPAPGAATLAADATEHHFTGKERDAESGLDYFGARYYASTMGRFLSPDWSEKVSTVPYADLANPQSLNLYSYVTNNPLNRTDPMGHDWFYVDKKWQWQQGSVFHDAKGNATKDKGYQYLLVFNKTGTNKYGAATGTLTLYNQNKVAASDPYVFSGGPNSPAHSNPIPNGNYMIMAGNKGDFHDDSQINNKTWSPFPFYGIETMSGIHRPDFTYDPTVEWGHLRAMLNHADNGDDAFQGNYLHGKIRPEDYTHGCICERSEQILNMIWKLNTQVPVEVK